MKKPLINRILAAICLLLIFLSGLWAGSHFFEGKGMVLDTNEVVMYVGDTLTLKVDSENGYPLKGYTIAVNGSHVDIDPDLKVTALSEGSAVITFTGQDGSVAECYFTVLSHPEDIRVSANTDTGYVGDSISLDITAIPETATYTYQIVSSDESKVSVKGNTLELKSEGVATVTVTTDNGITAEFDITVFDIAPFTLGDLSFRLYESVTFVTDVLGEPDGTVQLPLGSVGYIYDGETGYTVIFTDGQIVTGVYTDRPDFSYGGITWGQSSDEVTRITGEPFENGHSVIRNVKEIMSEIYFDVIGGGRTYGILVVGDGCNTFIPPNEETAAGYSRVLFDITNSFRRRHGVALLEYYEPLEEATLAHCQDMIANDFVGHVSSDGRRLEARMNSLDLLWHYCAENIAVGYRTPFAALAGLMNSQSHRDSLLSEKYALVGISTLFDKTAKYGIYTTQIFCTLF